MGRVERPGLLRLESPVLVDARGRPIGNGAISRRSFVKTSGGIVVAAGTGVACASDGKGGFVEPTAFGSLQGVVTGLDASAANGGTVTVTALDVPEFEPITVTLPASGNSGVVPDIPVGNYRLAYAPPANHALAPGVTNPQDVVVSDGVLTTVTWAVVVAQSTVRVTVTGVDAGASDGGSASVLRTDITGQSPVVLNIPVSGTADLGVTVGTYDVTYTPPANHTVNSGVTNPVTVTATSGAIAPAAFAVTFAGGGGGGTGQPGNLYNHGFEDDTFGQFTNASNQTPTNAGYGIVTDSARGAKGINKAVSINAGNQGSGLIFSGPSFSSGLGVTSLFFRFAMKQSATADNKYPIKICRVVESSFGNLMEIVWNSGGANHFGIFAGGYDAFLNVLPNMNLPAPKPDDFRGQWHWYETHFDITTDNNILAKLWIDDTQYIDHIYLKPTLGKVISRAAFFATINRSDTAWDCSFDHFGFGTQRMGIPP